MASLGIALACSVLAASLLGAQEPSATGATISGIVFDSIGSRTLAGASVQIMGAAGAVLGQRFQAVADSAGRFVIRGVPPGDYAAGFVHPRLDSLGIESEPVHLVASTGTARLDLATPSPATFVRLVCTDDPAGGLLVGHVRATDTQEPLVGAGVVATWTEIDTSGVVVAPRNRLRAVTASPAGWFALCGLPPDVSMMVRAGAGTDSSGLVRITLPATGVEAATFHAGGAVRSADSPGLPATWSGSATLTGTVNDDRGLPVADASVSVWGSAAETTTDRYGRFALRDLPGGTQTLAVRAIGYLPLERTLMLSPMTPTTADLVLGSRVVMLEGVAVRANAGRARLTPFYDRMRDAERGINHGYFITPEDLERRKPTYLTQMLENYPTVRVLRGFTPLDDVVTGTNRCRMTVYLDNVRIVGTLSGKDDFINRLVPPNHVAAIEVYPRSVMAPPQYQPLNGTCGIVLIWTK